MQAQNDGLHRPLFTTDLLTNALNLGGDRPLLRTEGEPWFSVSQVRDLTSQFVQALASLGVGRGARVGLLSVNRREVLHVSHAVALSAAVYVPLHPMGSLQDHIHAIQDSGVGVLIFDPARYLELARDLAARTPGLRLISFDPCEGAEDLGAIVAAMRPEPLRPPLVEGNDIIRLGYSGGTTGKPKALAALHRTTTASASIITAEWEWPLQLRMLSCSPLSHAGGAMFLPMLLKGGSMIVLPTFDALKVLEAIQEHRITCTMLVPAMIYALLDHPRFDEFDLSSLETVFYGASLISPARLKEAIERIGPVFFQFYGQAEAPMSLTVLRKSEHDPSDPRRLASCGRPVPWVHLELLGPDNQPVAEGEPGEICVRGPLVMDGYLNAPELTAEAFDGGWLHTGDVAVRDPGGFLRIVDRKKDMIVSGGFNIYSRELEDILCEHPAVAHAAVVGLPHPKWGEAVNAVVALKAGAQVSEAMLVKFIADRKGSFQAPKAVHFIEAIPLTAVGKPDKKALRELYGRQPT